jgi:hypothetical protein
MKKFKIVRRYALRQTEKLRGVVATDSCDAEFKFRSMGYFLHEKYTRKTQFHPYRPFRVPDEISDSLLKPGGHANDKYFTFRAELNGY